MSDAEPAVVGGKGASLVGLCAAGVVVPEGVVLPTAFFAPWFQQVAESLAWSNLVQAADADLGAACEAVKAVARDLVLSDAQRAVLEPLGSEVMGWEMAAVRSSSPEEDLASASFAGGYETVLGVTATSLEDAVRSCFVSALDARVLRYKAEHGFDPYAPAIAVVRVTSRSPHPSGPKNCVNDPLPSVTATRTPRAGRAWLVVHQSPAS